MTLTAELIHLIRAKPISQADLDHAALMALDAVANAVAGANTDPGRRILAWTREMGLCGDGGLAGEPGRVGFVLGALCHILEVDDLHRASVVHPGCAVAPVLWAHAAWARGPLDGQRALTALLHGFEAATRLGMSVGPGHYKVWHNTATCGPFGSAMAACALLDLDEAACVHALGNVGTQAAGIWEFLATGAMSKHLHAGRAAEAGIVAASLAVHGFTGAPEILEGPRGLYGAMCPDADASALTRDPDAPWQANLTSIKPWPCCRHTHPAVDAAQELRDRLRERGMPADAVAEVEIGAYDAALALCDRPEPDSPYAAKFSLQHCVAAALTLDEVWFDAFEADKRAALAGLRSRCRVHRDADVAMAYPAAWGATLRLTLRNGETLEAARRQAKGDPDLPLTAEEMVAKARRLLAHGGVGQPDAFIGGVLAMAKGEPVPALPAPLGPAREQAGAADPALARAVRRSA